MEEGNWASETATGYSVDNLFPSVPSGLTYSGLGGLLMLYWDAPVDEDFQYYGIYRSTQSGFNPDTMDFYTYATVDTSFTDSDVEVGAAYYYSISAFDYSGNESEFSTQVSDMFLTMELTINYMDLLRKLLFWFQ